MSSKKKKRLRATHPLPQSNTSAFNDLDIYKEAMILMGEYLKQVGVHPELVNKFVKYCDENNIDMRWFIAWWTSDGIKEFFKNGDIMRWARDEHPAPHR